METLLHNTFAKDVLEGLSAKVKHLSSKYFYDESGDQLFQDIMNMPEYYLTDCETDIFQQQKDAILRAFSPGGRPFNLIELGAGDGLKTKILLKYFMEQEVDFTYYPIDISKHILAELALAFKTDLPGLKIEPIHAEYFEALNSFEAFNTRQNIILFLGSNIGNFKKFGAIQFLSQLATANRPGDLLFIGIDLKKDPNVILEAYNDSRGITAAFNLNLLTRINRELGADFNLNHFKHYGYYNPENGEVTSYIISKKEQSVRISKLNRTIHFKAHEFIHTEISKKYNLQEIEHLADNAGYRIVQNFIDSDNYFVDSLWQIK